RTEEMILALVVEPAPEAEVAAHHAFAGADLAPRRRLEQEDLDAEATLFLDRFDLFDRHPVGQHDVAGPHLAQELDVFDIGDAAADAGMDMNLRQLLAHQTHRADVADHEAGRPP